MVTEIKESADLIIETMFKNFLTWLLFSRKSVVQLVLSKAWGEIRFILL